MKSLLLFLGLWLGLALITVAGLFVSIAALIWVARPKKIATLRRCQQRLRGQPQRLSLAALIRHGLASPGELFPALSLRRVEHTGWAGGSWHGTRNLAPPCRRTAP